MKLETLLKPIKYLDENVILRQYTKLGKKINIDKGKKKYVIGLGLDFGIYVWFGGPANRELFGSKFDWGDFFILGLNESMYNLMGLIGFKESNSSDSIALDPQKEHHKKYNLKVRLPTFLFGAGLIGKFGVDLVTSIKNKTPLDAISYNFLLDGIGHLSLASSMYLKETDPKLLDKAPLWKKALDYIQEKASLIGQQPVPVPITNYQIVENK